MKRGPDRVSSPTACNNVHVWARAGTVHTSEQRGDPARGDSDGSTHFTTLEDHRWCSATVLLLPCVRVHGGTNYRRSTATVRRIGVSADPAKPLRSDRHIQAAHLCFSVLCLSESHTGKQAGRGRGSPTPQPTTYSSPTRTRPRNRRVPVGVRSRTPS